jgi:uncharacterized coiled-coil protein SlyX
MTEQRKRIHVHDILRSHEARLVNMENGNDGEKQEQLLNSVNNKMDELVGATKGAVDNVQNRVTELEGRLSEVSKKLEDTLKNTGTFCEQMLRMEAQNAVLTNRLDDLNNNTVERSEEEN